MPMTDRPTVLQTTGGKCWEHTFDLFHLKAYIPDNDLDGQVNNYGFRAPLLLVFEEEPQSMDSAVAFARETGLAAVAAARDTSVLFVHPVRGAWADQDELLYTALISEIKMIQVYRDGIVESFDFFKKEFKGYFIRGAIFRADLYAFGASADYVATHLLKTVQGEYLWGPGEITPAVCSLERLSVMPDVQRTDIPILSVGNSEAINRAFDACDIRLIKDKAEYEKDFDTFIRKYKRWCGVLEEEPDFPALGMTEDAGSVTVNTSPDNWEIKEAKTHRAGYFAYYNNSLFDNGPAPLVIGFHGGGDSSMYLTYVAGWWEVAHAHNFLFVSVENHQFVTASEAAQLIAALRERYPVDARRIYATGFSMGSGKTWDCFQEFPELFAGVMPCSALFPVYTTFWGTPAAENLNRSVPVPCFYSGGELSPLPELPFQAPSCLERVQYVARVNRLKKADAFLAASFDHRDAWEDPQWVVPGDRTEKVPDPSRGGTLTIHYYDSDDGVCRTAFAGVSNQQHECRRHSCENAWKFISRFSREQPASESQ